MRGRVAKVQKRPQLETGVGPQRVEGPRTIRELVALTLHRVEVGRREVILVIHEPHVVERLGRIEAVFDGEVEQVERSLPVPLTTTATFRSFAAPNAARTPSKYRGSVSLPSVTTRWRVICTMRERPSRLPLRQSLDFFAAILIPLLNAREIRVGTIAARQVLLVECRVLADQVTICLVDVGERP